MPYGIRATLATSHESARRGYKYWISEIGVNVDLGNCQFTGLSTSRKMISFWCAMSRFRTFETALFFPDAHERLTFPDKISARHCLERVNQIIQETALIVPADPCLQSG